MNREIIAKMDRITKVFGKQSVLKDLSFSLEKGEVHGLLGPNGAGKTTSLRILSGLLSSDVGKVEINGIEVKAFEKKKTQIFGILLEEAPLYGDMKVEEYLVYIAKLNGVKAQNLKAYVQDSIVKTSLEDVTSKFIKNLSRGYRQRVAIAQAIVHKPQILILDEPTLGLDPQTLISIRELIIRLKEDHSIILSSHMLHEMSIVCDRVTILSKGRVVESGTIESIRSKLKKNEEIVLTLDRPIESFEEEIKSKFNCIVSQEKNVFFIQNQSQSDIRAELISLCVNLNQRVLGLTLRGNSLEDIFLEATRSVDV